MANIFTSADQLVGKTPLLELTHIEKEYNLQAKIYAKLEYFNPAGSVKDRIAKSMIEDEYEAMEEAKARIGMGLYGFYKAAEECRQESLRLCTVPRLLNNLHSKF